MKRRELAMTVDFANLLGKLSKLPMNGRQRQRSAHHDIFKDASDHATVLTARYKQPAETGSRGIEIEATPSRLEQPQIG